jgi:hypothetical protein
MGLLLDNNYIEITDADGNVRFSTTRRMPHLLHVVSGSFSLPNVQGTSTFSVQSDESGYSFPRSGFSASTTHTQTILTSSNITNSSDSFIAPFLTISSGDFATGSYVASGLGSSILFLFIRDDGYFAGSRVMTLQVNGDKLQMITRDEAITSGQAISNYSYSDSASPGYHYESNWPYGEGQTIVFDNLTVTTTLSNTSVTIGYKVYYGRYQ